MEIEPGTELFRGSHGEDWGWDIAFGPVGEAQPCWSLFRLSGGTAVERIVLFASRPSRSQLRVLLSEVAGQGAASELIARVGKLQHFYDGYYAARPDLARRRLTAVA